MSTSQHHDQYHDGKTNLSACQSHMNTENQLLKQNWIKEDLPSEKSTKSDSYPRLDIHEAKVVVIFDRIR
jgi:hypothetical protein